MNDSTVGFYHTRIGECRRCNMPEHLFASSITTEYEFCVNCWAGSRYWDLDVVSFPTAETHPIMAEPIERCQACEHLFLEDSSRWGKREGHALLANGDEIVTHVMCVAPQDSCRNCDFVWARTRYRGNGNYAIASHLFMTFDNIDGNQLCRTCGDIHMEDYGGEDNFFRCPACSHMRPYDDSRDWEGDTYCEACYDNNTYECENCGEIQWRYNDHDCGEDDDSLIHSYSYRPSPYFFGKGKYHFGFELEVEARRNSRYDGARLVTNHLGARAYLKDDGSLSDGFEIVTHPHTLETYQKEFDWQVLDRLKDEGYRSWNTSTCGLHVHVSRSAFGNGDPWEYPLSEDERSRRILARQAHELRFMKLIYDNQRQVERIAGRSENSYASFNDKGKLVRKIKYGHQENGRYSAINTENDTTLEVRVFKGSLRKERVLSAVEFVHACVEYTRDVKVTSKNHALSWLKFTGYISSNVEAYPNLVTIMSESFAGDSNPDETN